MPKYAKISKYLNDPRSYKYTHKELEGLCGDELSYIMRLGKISITGITRKTQKIACILENGNTMSIKAMNNVKKPEPNRKRASKHLYGKRESQGPMPILHQQSLLNQNPALEPVLESVPAPHPESPDLDKDYEYLRIILRKSKPHVSKCLGLNTF